MPFQFIKTDRVAAPMGPYSLGVRANGMVLTSGQLPTDPTTGEVVDGDIQAQVRQALNNLSAVLEAAGSAMDQVIKLTIFLRHMDDLGAVADVRREFWTDPHPTSTTVEISRLPKEKARVEVEAIALAPDA